MPHRILVVDDDPQVRESLGVALTLEGYRPSLAANGVEALQQMAVSGIDLVLLDLNMPVKNGWDTFERLSADYPEVPVIVVTARPNQLFLSLAAGVGGLMEKPLHFPTLLSTIHRLLHEPIQVRRARLAGRHARFHYHPAGGNDDPRPWTNPPPL